MRRRSSCRNGIHVMGEPSIVGGGIVRRVCENCGAVEIDLPAETPVDCPGLFGPVRSDSMFMIQVALEEIFAPQEQRFGVRQPEAPAPATRR